MSSQSTWVTLWTYFFGELTRPIKEHKSEFAISVLALVYLFAQRKITSLAAWKENFWEVVSPIVWWVCIIALKNLAFAVKTMHREIRQTHFPSEALLITDGEREPSRLRQLASIYFVVLCFSAVIILIPVFCWIAASQKREALQVNRLPTQTRETPTQESPGSVEFRLTPYVLIHRHPPKPGWTFAPEYGFSAVLYVRNGTATPRQVQFLEVAGDVASDCSDYFDAVVKEGQTIDEVGRECGQRKPYRRLRWIANPIEHGRLEAKGDESFIRFTFLKPEGDMRVLPGDVDQREYFGSVTEKKAPKLPTTSVHVLDLVEFTAVSGNELTSPKLRNELNGKPIFRIVVDGKENVLPASSVNAVMWELDQNWSDRTPADLFWGMTGTSYDRFDSRAIKKPRPLR